MERFEESMEAYRESMAIRLEVFGDKHPSYATCLYNMGLLLSRMNRFEEAISYSHDCWEIQI